MRVHSVLIGAGLAVLLVAPAAVAQDQAPPGPGPEARLSGEVVAIREQARTANQGEVTEIQVQTRTRARQWLRLGPADQFGDTVQVGDQVRLRYRLRGDGEPPQVSAMQNLRTRSRYRIHQGQGPVVGPGETPGDCTGLQEQERVRSRERARQRQGSQSQTGRRGGTRSGNGR